MTGQELLASLGRMCAAKLRDKTEFRGETTFWVDRENLRDVVRFCRDELGFDYLLDISSVDNYGEEPRFQVVYELYSLSMNVHVRLKTAAPEDDPNVDTISDVWPAADWHEREIYDMMGIRFNNHPDLRRILMWEGYPYFPLRKEFPVEGLPSNLPDVAFTAAAPLEGGPFVTVPSTATVKDREPRARRPADSD